jgi:fumarate reductase subunit C
MTAGEARVTRGGYVRPMPKDWFLRRKRYTWFMVRELTSLFIGGYALFLVLLVQRARDAASFEAFVDALRSPISVALHVIAIVMALFHTVTWFNATPAAVALYRGKDRVSPALIVGSNYVVWLIVSLAVVWLALGGRA